MPVRFGLVVSGQNPGGMPPPETFRQLAVLAEELGFDSIWSTDHLSFVNPILEGLISLAAMAGYTQRVALGVGVLLLPLRHPSLVAKQVASLDYLSGGRTIFGIGVGGEGAKDFEAVEIPRNERGARTDEALGVLRRLWSGEAVSHHGRFYSFEDIQITPAPLQRPGPPIWVGGRSPAALRRTGREGDGWLAYPASPKRVAADWDVIRSEADAAGRSADDIVFGQTLTIAVAGDTQQAKRQVAEHLSARYGRSYDPEKVTSFSVVGPPDACSEQLQAYIETGVRHFVFIPTGPPEGVLEEVEQLYQQVVGPLADSLP